MKKKWSVVFTLLILGLLAYVLKEINFYEVYLLLIEANFLFLTLAFICMALTYLVWNFRWIYIFRDFVKTDFFFFLKVLLAGSFFNTVTPGAGIGGEPFRAHYISLKYGKSSNKVLGYVLGDTFFRIFVLFLFIIFSVFFVLIYIKISLTLKYVLEGILIFVLLSLFGGIFFLWRKSNFHLGTFFRKLYRFKLISNKFINEEEFVKFLDKKINTFYKIFKKVIKNKKNFSFGVILSFLFWMFNYLTAYFLFLAFGNQVNFLSVIIVVTLGNIFGSLSPVPGGVGVTESSMVLLYSAMGVVSSLALLVAFIQRIIYYFFSLFLGGISLINLNVGLNKKFKKQYKDL